MIAAITSCTNTSNPTRDARRGPARAERGEEGTQDEAVGEDVARAGLEGRHRLSATGRRAGVSRPARLPARRLRLHDVHRQLRSAARADRAGDRERASSSTAAVLSGNRNFEGRVNPLTRFNYLASPPLVVAYALAGRMDLDLTREPIGIGSGRPGLPARHLADAAGSAGRDPAQREERVLQARSTPTCSRATSSGSRSTCRRGETYAWDDELDVREEPAVLRGHDDGAAGHSADHRRARARDARRFDHDRSHLAGGQHSGVEPGREMADRARRREEGLQLVRRAARQSRSDDARHVREHPPAQRDGAGHRGRLDDDRTGRHAGVHLRRVDGVPEGRARRSSSSPARSTAPARRATGRPRARCCSACAR